MTCIQKDKCNSSSSSLVSDNNNNNNSHLVSIGNGVDTMPLEAVVSLLTNVIAHQQKQKMADNTSTPPQKSRKRVRFSTTTNNNNNNNDNDNGVLQQNKAPALMKELTLETARKLWYSKADIAAFKTQAKQIVLNKAHTSEDISGFERFDAKRSKEKKSTLHFVILSQMVKRDAEFQRHVSRKCTAGAKVIALNQALEDFCAVYDPLACLLGASSDGKKYHESLFMGNPALNCSSNSTNNNNNKRSVEQMLQVPTVHEIPAMVSEFNAVGGGEATVTPCYPPNTTTATTSRRVRRRVTPPLTAWT